MYSREYSQYSITTLHGMESTECNLQKHQDPGLPVVMTHASTAGGTDSILAWESHASECNPKTRKKKPNPHQITMLCT